MVHRWKTERGGIRRASEWVLVSGHRGIVAGVTVSTIFVFIAAVTLSGVAPLTNVQPLYYVFSGLLGGNVTLITVVVSINQLLLSRELNRPDELRGQINGVVEYRRDVEEAAGQVAPMVPSRFLRLLTEATRREAQRLGGLVKSEASDAVYDEVDEAVTALTRQTDRVDALLKRSDASLINVLSATFTTNFAKDIHSLHQVESRHGDSLPTGVTESIDDLVHLLQDMDIAREYFKTLYLHEELAFLSRILFYLGLPSLAILASGLFFLTGVHGTFVPSTFDAVLLSALVSAGFLPISVLFAFILRIATVTQRTAATLPFVTPTQSI